MRCRFVPAWLSALLPWGLAAWLSAAVPAHAGETAPAPDRLPQLLDDMQKTRDDDFSTASSYMLELTGDELAFVRRMRELAAKGHPVAMAWRALHMEGGHGSEVMELLSGASKEYAPAIVWLARHIHDGWEGTPPDAQLAKAILMRACKMGNAQARALYLKWGHLDGRTVDCTRAELASELKRHNSYLEEYMADCPGLDADWLAVASEHGSAKAAYRKSVDLAETDPSGAARYLRLAAERHHPAAMARLGCSLYASATPGSDEAKGGLDLLRHAAATGESPRAAALVALAYAYCAMGQGERFASTLPDAVSQVSGLFRYAHEHGDPLGTIGWGYCLVAGKGCTRDAAQGLSLLVSAAGKSPAFAALALYHVYNDGIGVDADQEKAREYAERFKESDLGEADIWVFADRSLTAPFMPGLE